MAHQCQGPFLFMAFFFCSFNIFLKCFSEDKEIGLRERSQESVGGGESDCGSSLEDLRDCNSEPTKVIAGYNRTNIGFLGAALPKRCIFHTQSHSGIQFG